jgi:hypothetical protein
MTKDDLLKCIANDFIYHTPVNGQPERYNEIRAGARQLAEFIVENTPISREQSLALTSLEEAVFYANAAIARNEVQSSAQNQHITSIKEEL